MYIRKDNGPSIETYGTHEEYCPFTTLLSYLGYNKSVTVFNKLPDIHFFFKFMKETFVPNLIKDFRYIKKYTPRFVALFKRFIK